MVKDNIVYGWFRPCQKMNKKMKQLFAYRVLQQALEAENIKDYDSITDIEIKKKYKDNIKNTQHEYYECSGHIFYKGYN